MKKRVIKSILAVVIAVMFFASTSGAIFAAQSASVASKEEVVYANVSAGGEVKEVSVVNIFNLKGNGTIEDYGQYTDVKNLSTTTEVVNQDGKITVEGEGERFYYQGNMQNAQLPWHIGIEYYLNGKKVSADELAGSSGQVEMVLKTTKNANVNAAFFNNYVVQITVTLNTDLCKNISAPDGMFANAGKNKLITFTALPEKNATYKVSMQATDFEMEGMQFAAVPFSMGFDLPNVSGMTSGFSALTNAVGQLSNGTNELTGGILKSKNGLMELNNGSAAFQSGLGELSDNGGAVLNGSQQILQGITAINQGFQSSGGGDLTAFGQLPTAMRGFATALDGVAQNLTTLNTQYQSAYTTLAQNNGGIPAQSVSNADLDALLTLYPTDQTLAALVSNYKETHAAVGTLKTNFGANNASFTNLLTGLPTAAGTLSGSQQSISANLNNFAATVEGALNNSDFYQGLVNLGKGLGDLQTQYTTFHTNLGMYTGGVTTMSTQYANIAGGIHQMATGMGELYNGSEQINNGLKKLHASTKDIPRQIQEKINEYMTSYDKSDYKPISFVSEKNTNVSSVQFVIKTDKIEKVQPEKVEEVQPEKPSFWTKLKDLFQ